MKKINILFLVLLFSLKCLGQQIEIGRNATINMPAKTKKLNKVELKSFIDSTFGNSPVAIKSAMNTNSDYTYKKDGVLVSLSYGDKSLEKNFLAGSKTELDDMFKESKSYLSVLKTVNNNNVLIIYMTFGRVGYYSFQCNNNQKVSSLNGSIHFNKVDKDKATDILNDILKNLNFEK